MDEPTQEPPLRGESGQDLTSSQACTSGPQAGRTPTGKDPVPRRSPCREARRVRKHYATVEIDSTFYGTPRRSTVERWREISPEGFLFAAKFPQEITHDKHLVGSDELTRTFVDTMRLLLDRLGPLLVQLRPRSQSRGWGYWKISCPPSRRASVTPSRCATELARLGPRVAARAWRRPDPHRLPRMPRMEDATADFVYIRWLGDRREFPSDHTHPKRDRTGISHGGPRGSSAFSRAARSSPTRTTTTRTTPSTLEQFPRDPAHRPVTLPVLLQYRFPLLSGSSGSTPGPRSRA